MIDQLIIGDKASFDDFGASVAKRLTPQPKKKSIKETVPYSNITYDYSAIDGELYWEERELEYVFEMTAPTPEELEEMKAAFADWVMMVFEEDLHDPFIPDYHFKATYDDMDWEDDEGLEKTTATVKFKAYPYKISNTARKYSHSITPNATIDVNVINDSSHKIVPTITASADIVIKEGSMSYAVGEGETTDATFTLKKGSTSLKIQNPNSFVCTVEIAFFEEVM